MTKTESSEKTDKKIVNEKTDMAYYEAVGRRRESSCRVRLYINKESMVINGTEVKKGEIVANNRMIDKYFTGEVNKKIYLEPFRTTNTLNRFITVIKVKGGGESGQLGAIVLGISRALEKIDKEKYRPILKKKGFMTRDSRIKQRRKAGYAGKSRAKKQSPKR